MFGTDVLLRVTVDGSFADFRALAILCVTAPGTWNLCCDGCGGDGGGMSVLAFLWDGCGSASRLCFILVGMLLPVWREGRAMPLKSDVEGW